MPLYIMKNDVIKYQSFDIHFDLEVMYNTSQRCLANRKEKELIYKNRI